jgi:NAD(P)-dependent dehydrogenase (short-subunit alcohol dehydrogenase family)
MSDSLLGLEGKVAVVTGGGGNIGRATVAMLVQAGARVVAADVDGSAAQSNAEEAMRAGGEAVGIEADATREEDVDRMVGLAVSRWGGLDIGVNIVGGGGGNGRILDTPDEVWDRALELNLYTTLRCSRAFARTMIERQTAGSIINIASPAGLRGVPTMAAYGAAKAAVISLTWTLAVELAPNGIRVNVVVPAFVPRPGDSPGWGGNREQQDELARQVVPMGRTTKAEDVAGAIVCFASNLTSFSTGQMIVCDGGRLLTNPLLSAALATGR